MQKNGWSLSGLLFMSVFTTSAVANTSPWQHPGVLVSQAQLDFIKQQVAAHNQPWYQEFLNAEASVYGSKTYTAKGPWPGGVNQCGPYSSPNQGCSDADSDIAAAYVQALLWYITDDNTYAQNAIAIMNKYAYNFKGFAGYTTGYPCPTGTSCSNGPLQAGWDSEKWPRAAEIIRYGNGGSAGWAAADIAAFSAMLKNIYEPIIYNGNTSNSNWELTMVDGMMGIAVFNEDLALLQHAQTQWQQSVPSYFYNFQLDNSLYPGKSVPFWNKSINWYGQTIFNTSTTGVAQETCRDLGHTGYGIAAAIDAAETDYIQGGTLTANLYTSNGAEQRLVTSLNLMAGLELANSTTAPTSFCTGSGGQIVLGNMIPTWVIGYNEYHNRLNDPNMAGASGTSGQLGTANTYNWIQKNILPSKLPVDAHMAVFEPLTHYADAGTAISTGTLALSAGSASDPNCASAIDTLYLDGSASGSTFTVSQGVTQALTAGSHTFALKSLTTSLPAGGGLSGTCTGTISASSVTIQANQTTPVTVTYKYQAAASTGTVSLSASAGSDARCVSASDTLYLDGSTTGTAFTVSNGVTKTVTTGQHQLALASSKPIPAGGTQSGTCTGILSAAQVTVLASQTTPVTVTYQFSASTQETCKLVSPSITIVNWGNLKIDSFTVSVLLTGFPVDSSGDLTVNGTVVMKNIFDQNFWSTTGFTAAINGNTGTFSGKFYPGSSSNTFTLQGFLTDGTPVSMSKGDNPVSSMTVNGVVCN